MIDFMIDFMMIMSLFQDTRPFLLKPDEYNWNNNHYGIFLPKHNLHHFTIIEKYDHTAAKYGLEPNEYVRLIINACYLIFNN